MKYIISIVSITITLLSFGQSEVVFYDDIYNTVVPKVKVYNAKKEFIGLSNQQGAMMIASENYPITYEKHGYEHASVASWTDTVVLSPKYQDIEEVVIKPVNKMDLYNEIVEHSNSILNKEAKAIKGVYFESVMVVHPKKNDTVYLDNICDLILKKTFDKKKVDYAITCSNGVRNYRNNASKEMEDFDTSVLNICLRFVQPFKKTLKYDLSDTKNYKLKFDEEQITRSLGANMDQLVFQNDEKYSAHIEVNYKDLKLFSWDHQTRRIKPYTGEKIFVNYKKAGRYIQFDAGDHYFFNTVIVNGLVQIAVDGDFYEIYVVKGFMEDESVNFESTETYKDVEDYLETVGFSQGGVARYYTFETEN